MTWQEFVRQMARRRSLYLSDDQVEFVLWERSGYPGFGTRLEIMRQVIHELNRIRDKADYE